MSRVELQACPMCGGRAAQDSNRDEDDIRWGWIVCTSCGVRTRGKWGSDDIDPSVWAEIRDEWNRRSPAPAADEAKDALVVVRNGVALFTGCADEYIAAVESLTAIREDGPSLIDRLPSQSPEAYDAWMQLNNTGKRLRECVSKLRALTTAAQGDKP